MKQMTIRGFDEQLERAIWKLADRDGISRNRAALRLLRRGAGIDRESNGDRIGNTLDHLSGTWTDEQARLIEEAEQDFESIDPELWA